MISRASAVARAAAVSAYLRREGIPVQSGRSVSAEGVMVSHGGVYPGAPLASISISYDLPSVTARMTADVNRVLKKKYVVYTTGTIIYVRPKEED